MLSPYTYRELLDPLRVHGDYLEVASAAGPIKLAGTSAGGVHCDIWSSGRRLNLIININIKQYQKRHAWRRPAKTSGSNKPLTTHQILNPTHCGSNRPVVFHMPHITMTIFLATECRALLTVTPFRNNFS